MNKHGKIYRDYFHKAAGDMLLCEVCGGVATEIHHIDLKGMGGSDDKDYIENLIALCRYDHSCVHGTENPPMSAEFITECHKKFIENFNWIIENE